MRRPTLPLLVLVAILGVAASALAGCGSSAAKDPYDLLTDSTTATWDPIQINVGVSATAGGQTISLDRSTFAFVLDRAGGKGAFHMSIPARDLGAQPAALRAIGIDGDSIDFDGLFDGHAMYGRGALLVLMLRQSLAPTQDLPRGDLSGWLKLGTVEEFTALAELAGRAAPSMAAPSNLPTSIRETLDSMGVVLTLAGTEHHDTGDAWHITATVDTDKLLASPMFSTANPAQAAQVKSALGFVTVSAEVWIDVATARTTELDIRLVAKSDASQNGIIRVFAADPDGSVSLEAPSKSIDVPLSKMLQDFLKMMEGGALS